MSSRFLTHAQIAVLPTLNEAVYEVPSPSKNPEKKSCGNCALFSLDLRCGIHAPDRVVFAFDNCSYHVPGVPKKRRLPIHMDPPLDPKYSGLGFYPGGTHCGGCTFYNPDHDDAANGDCLRIRQDDRVAYARVKAMGCSSRYKPKPWITL